MSTNQPLSLSGLASGIDTSSIVDALMQIERQPENRLNIQKQQISTRQSVMQDLQTRLQALKDAADALSDPGLWADTQSVTSSDSSLVDVSRLSGAGVGGTQIVVQRLASSQQRTYTYTASASDTQIDFGSGVTIAIAANSSIDDVVSAINSSSASPVYAAAITDPNNSSNRLLVLSSKTAGSQGDFAPVFNSTTTNIVEDTTKAKAQALTTAQQVFSYTTDSLNSTTITINGKQVTSGPGATASTVANDINNASAGVTASVDSNGKLVLTSNLAGVAGNFTTTGTQLTSLSSTLGTDATSNLQAQYTVDGGPVQTADSNVVTNAIPGVQLTFKAATGTSGVTVTVGSPGPDHDAIKSAVKAFIDQYNSTVDFMRSKLTEKPVVNPQSTDDYLKGLFFGDSLFDGILSRLRMAIMSPIGTDSSLDLLSEIGISTGATTGDGTINQDSVDGKLTLDESQLDSMLDTNPQGVRQLLGAAGGIDGFAQAIDGVLDPEIEPGQDFDQQIQSMSSQLSDIANQMADMDERLQETQDRLKAQFAAMETALSQSQSQQQWLAGQIAGLPQIG